MRKYIMAYLRKRNTIINGNITFGLYSVTANNSMEALGLALKDLKEKFPTDVVEINSNMVSVDSNIDIKRE